MVGDYRKFRIEMKMLCSRYRLWKRGIDLADCILETYKTKRSVYFAVSNLLPSEVLMREERKEYRLLLIGEDQGEIVHQDFGAFYINHRGEGAVFKKFSGPPIDCYRYCIFAAVSEGEKMETIFQGEIFSRQKKDADSEATEDARRWAEIFSRFYENASSELFSADADETGAYWCKVAMHSPLPEPIRPCSDLIDTYGHYIIGRKEERSFIGIPGRFLKKEQPMGENHVFSLWQPLRGGEKFFKNLAELTEPLAEEIFGYWIGEIDRKSGAVFPV